MDLTFLLLLSFKLVLNLEDLDPNIKTLWSTFALAKVKISHNPTSELFRIEVDFFCRKMKQDK